jgi:hypothetical protein
MAGEPPSYRHETGPSPCHGAHACATVWRQRQVFPRQAAPPLEAIQRLQGRPPALPPRQMAQRPMPIRQEGRPGPDSVLGPALQPAPARPRAAAACPPAVLPLVLLGRRPFADCRSDAGPQDGAGAIVARTPTQCAATAWVSETEPLRCPHDMHRRRRRPKPPANVSLRPSTPQIPQANSIRETVRFCGRPACAKPPFACEEKSICFQLLVRVMGGPWRTSGTGKLEISEQNHDDSTAPGRSSGPRSLP